MRYFEREGQRLLWRNHGETVVAQPWGEDSLRVRSTLMGDVCDSRFALMEPLEVTDVEIHVEDERASLRCGKITLVMETDGWRKGMRMTFLNQHGKTLLSETDAGNALILKARKFEPILGGDYALSVTFTGQDDERLHGMGQYQEETLDWKGCTLELAHRNSQASVPFVLSSRGYGFLWHNPAIGQVSFGKNRTTWHAESTKQMDYWITAGDTPAEISLHYAQATGFAPMMPEHGLGFWQCKLRYWNQEQLLEVAREYKRRNLPLDVIVCDFFHWPKMGDYRFDPEFFSDPAAMVKELNDMGVELMVSVWPLVSLTSENYEEMLQQGLLIHAEYGEQIGLRFVEDSMFFDATNPRARAYVWDKCKKNYYDYGIHTFWLDEAEPELQSYDFKNFRYHEGSGQQVGNLYPQMFSRMFWEGMTQSGQANPVNLVRCAWAGSQRYGALVWSGDIMSDWSYFRRQLCAGLSMGMAGIPWWTTDIGGFHGGNPQDPEFRELLIRWFQWGCYCPVMRLHGDRQPGEPVVRQDGTVLLNSGSGNEVWSFGEEAYPILVKYLKRREEMRPYIRELMREAHETGKPLMRAMCYAYPDEEAARTLKDQYLFGDRYLVAPVMQPHARNRKVYFPAGGAWMDVESKQTYEGGRFATVDAPLSSIPVFERAQN